MVQRVTSRSKVLDEAYEELDRTLGIIQLTLLETEDGFEIKVRSDCEDTERLLAGIERMAFSLKSYLNQGVMTFQIEGVEEPDG